jgi:hypothetical protein
MDGPTSSHTAAAAAAAAGSLGQGCPPDLPGVLPVDQHQLMLLLLLLLLLQARWGKVAHLTFLVFCLLTNIIVTSMLILGGAAVVNGLTGKPQMWWYVHAPAWFQL